jgi:hypothetical protein
MKRWGLILAVAIITVGAWVDWTYHSVRTEIAEIKARLPSEEELDKMPPDQSTEQLKLAMKDCDRVASLEGNPIAQFARGDDLKALSEQCDLIKTRFDSLQGP